MFVEKLIKRIDQFGSARKIGLFPSNHIADQILAVYRGEDSGIEVFSGSTQQYDAIVICADSDKVDYLKNLADLDWGERTPKIIMAGKGHMRPTLERVKEVESLLKINSEATGYAFTKEHLCECLLQLRKSGLTGNVIELGVFNGGTLGMLYNISRSLGILDNLKFTGFDTWDGKLHRKSFLDLFDLPEWAAIDMAIAKNNLTKDIDLVKGDISVTVPEWIQNTEDPIVLAFIDTDNYSPTADVLPGIWNKLSVGGFVVFDHYYTKEGFYNTIGEHIAANDFFRLRSDYFNLSGTGVFMKVK